VAAFKGGAVLFLTTDSLNVSTFIARSGAGFKPNFHIVPCGVSAVTGPSPGKLSTPASVAGEGVVGPCGPRTGNSSGVRPGNSSGLGDSPGSRIGGGTSGRGFPGGLSCGGSDGCPGLIGGSSCGSIGISQLSSFRLMVQRRGAGNVPAASNSRR
jgi:hypothetical protein